MSLPTVTLPSGRLHHVVIIGGGFAGLNAALALKGSPVEVTLIDKRNFHLFQPLLYQVATGSLSPANIAAPLRKILARQKNCRVLMGEVTGFDLDRRRVKMADREVRYDSLIVATGASHSYFGRPDWEQFAPGLKTIEDATEARRRVFTAYETAERLDEPEARAPWLTFVIVGAGPTGVELAGAMAEIARHSLTDNFRSINPRSARIVLLEAGPRVLSAFPEHLSEEAKASLERLGVEVQTGAMVTEMRDGEVEYRLGDVTHKLATHTILWAAGVQCSPLAKKLAEAAGADTDRTGRLVVNEDLTLPGQPEVFVIGDMAHRTGEDGKPLPGVAPVAIAQGKYAAKEIVRRVRGKKAEAFRYRDVGSLATIGRSSAVAQIGKHEFSGFSAWALWLVIHLMKIVSFRNRVLVLIQWCWSYVSYDRSARLITGADKHVEPSAAPMSGPTSTLRPTIIDTGSGGNQAGVVATIRA